MGYNHEDPKHIYHRRRNPSGCDKYYCLTRFSWYWKVKWQWYRLRRLT